MTQYVIIEKLKEVIADKKAIAAVFYTYNFSAKIFENYILPIFLPQVNFSDNEIQNSILWRKYANELPYVTVYCDFHAKGPDAPNLGYKIRTVDLPAKNSEKACFHPKVSFILLDDNSLIVITGSNNLTEGGWCTNKEIIAIEVLKSGENFPYHQKHQLWSFLKASSNDLNYTFSEAEKILDTFFSQRSHTEGSNFQFYHSGQESFLKFLQHTLKENEEDCFETIEIISPYISTGEILLKEMLPHVKAEGIFINVPYKAMNEADITENNYNAYLQAGVKWSKFRETEKEKSFRFNHSKIYRLLTAKNMFTLIGSVNFTDAAWRGRKENGNVETAIMFVEPANKWIPWLEEYQNRDIVFTQEQYDETNREKRADAPDFQFELNWLERTLEYKNLQKFNFKGIIKFTSRNIELKPSDNTINLDEKIIGELANNPIVNVKQYRTGLEFLYYPLQIGIESKPLPARLQLKDNELIELWEHVSFKEDHKSEIADLIERFIASRVDKEGDLLEDVMHTKSTLNMMASHISALIRLEERIFITPNLKRDFDKAKEMLNYYLFASNIDTLAGYRMLLQEMYCEKNLLPGVYWFFMHVLTIDFYDITKIKKLYKAMGITDPELNSKIKHITNDITKCSDGLKKELKNNGLNMDLLNWIKKELK